MSSVTGAEPRTLATGIDLLDRKLGGGLPAGSVTALIAPPASQSELFLYELASVRPALYVTALRDADGVRTVLSRLSLDGPELVVTRVDAAAPGEETLRLLRALPEDGTLVVDPARVFEQQPAAQYRAFLNDLRERIAARGGLAFFHCLAGDWTPRARDVTIYVADVVFRMTTERRGEQVESHLTVPKLRGGRSIDDVIKLSLTTDVDVDVSRNIV